MPAHTVIAILEAKPGKEEELATALKAVIEPSRSESGNIEYRLHQSTQNPQQFFLYETWENEVLHHAQFEKPYIRSLATTLPPLLANPFQLLMGKELNDH